MKWSRSLLLPALIWMGLMGVAQADTPCDSRPILRSVEAVVLLAKPVPQQVQARVDTGATISSLDAALAHRLGLDRHPVREIWIRNAHGLSKRPVVRLRFMLAGQVREGDFSLISRSDLPYPVLLGRRSLKGFLVDPAAE